jgi:hypothetical protein
MPMGDFKFGVDTCVACTKCTLNTSVNTNFEITQFMYIKDISFEGETIKQSLF